MKTKVPKGETDTNPESKTMLVKVPRKLDQIRVLKNEKNTQLEK